jgi:hypothetical protein
MTEVQVKDGDFVVVRDRWRLDCVQAIKVTKQMVFYMDTFWKPARERRLRIQDVLFSGPESAAKKLKEQLASSYAQKVTDQTAAADRMRKRDDGFIKAATLARCPQENASE